MKGKKSIMKENYEKKIEEINEAKQSTGEN